MKDKLFIDRLEVLVTVIPSPGWGGMIDLLTGSIGKLICEQCLCLFVLSIRWAVLHDHYLAFGNAILPKLHVYHT
jgi:hypothetical protein